MTITYGGDTIIDSSGGVLRPISSVMRNRIINGACVIDQRNAGASVTPTIDSTYTLDRWMARLSVASKFSVQQNAGSVTPPAGFTNYLGVTSLSAYTAGTSEFFSVLQKIEGFNIADLGWGTASAKTVTLSFWVRSSLTGTFGGVLRNGTGATCYPYSYTITSTNTWQQVSVVITGDTITNTYNTTNNDGIEVWFSLGAGSTVSGTAGTWSSTTYLSATGATSVVGTNGATFYITGVQLEVGSSATGFEYRQYGQELALCQRYYETSGTSLIVGGIGRPVDGYALVSLYFAVNKRAAPTVTFANTLTAGEIGTRGCLGNGNPGSQGSFSTSYTASAEL